MPPLRTFVAASANNGRGTRRPGYPPGNRADWPGTPLAPNSVNLSNHHTPLCHICEPSPWDLLRTVRTIGEPLSNHAEPHQWFDVRTVRTGVYKTPFAVRQVACDA